jgi:hypothetical protein
MRTILITLLFTIFFILQISNSKVYLKINDQDDLDILNNLMNEGFFENEDEMTEDHTFNQDFDHFLNNREKQLILVKKGIDTARNFFKN